MDAIANDASVAPRPFPGIPGAWAVHVADVDGDGDLDGIGGNRFDSGPDHIGVEWYENNGAVPPSFTVRKVSAGFVDAASVQAADVDGDVLGEVRSVRFPSKTKLAWAPASLIAGSG